MTKIVLSGQVIVPMDGATTISVVTQDSSGNPVGNAPLAISVSGSATLGSVPGSTSLNGQATFTVADKLAETVKVTVGSGTAQASLNIYFGANVSVNLQGDNLPANGEAAAQLLVKVQDYQGIPLEGVPVSVAFSPNSFAVAATAGGNTDASGVFTTSITDTVPETVVVTPIVGGLSTKPLPLTFTASALTKPTTVEVVLVENNVLADGKATGTLRVIARDAAGIPISGVPVSLVSSSATAVLAQIKGDTGDKAVFETTITDTKVEAVTVTANAGGVTSQATVNFVSEAGPAVASVTASLNKTQALANGSDQILLTVYAKDASGSPVVGAPVSFILDKGSVAFSPATGETDSMGRFMTTLTDKVVETVSITPKVSATQGTPVQAAFGATSGSTAVNSVTLNVANNNQPADGQAKISLVVVVRDANNTPMADVDVSLSSSSGAAQFDKASGKTGSGGSFTASVSSTKAETFTVTASAGGKTSNAASLTFSPSSATTPPAKITVTPDKESVPADGDSEITLIVITRDANNMPLKDVEITLSSDSGSALLTPASGKTGDNGSLSVKVTNTVAETVTVTANPAGNTSLKDSVNLIFSAVPSVKPASVILNVSGNSALADGEAKINLTVVVRDGQGMPIENAAVTLASSSLAALFDSTTGATGKTDAAGVFTTSMTSAKAENFTVTPTANGVTGQPVTITFIEAPEQKSANLRLLTSSTQLDSEGKPDGVIITAILTTAGNNPFPGATVSFSASSGVLQPIQVAGSTADAGVTDDAGVAMARLTTGGDPANRVITVTARSSGVPDATVTVEVRGTLISISGPDIVTTNSVPLPKFTVLLRDSSGKGVAGKTLKLSVLAKEGQTALPTVSNPAPVTDANGQTSVEVNPQGSGAYVLKAEWVDGNVSTEHAFSVSGDSFTVEPVDENGNALVNPITNEPYTLDNLPDTPLGERRYFKVVWPATLTSTVNISATRGTLEPAGGTLPLLPVTGTGTFSISANDAGLTTVTVTGILEGGVSGPSTQFSFDFVATKAVNLALQASPSTISPNTPGESTEQSQIIAVVRDAQNNLVKNSRVEFQLNDISGGRITPSFAYTDRNGRASIVYVAGSSSSGSGGVVVTARAFSPIIPGRFQDASVAGPQSVVITVAKRGLFISLGTGNEISEPNTTTYALPYTVYVTDADGVGIAGAEVFLSAIPRYYERGALTLITQPSRQWIPATDIVMCPNEDRVFDVAIPEHLGNIPQYVNNGILDPGEDLNRNGRIEPGNVVVVPGRVVTNQNGFAEFDVTYAQQYARWIYLELTARAVVAGTEGVEREMFTLPGSAADAQQDNPPWQVSPFLTAELGTTLMHEESSICTLLPLSTQ